MSCLKNYSGAKFLLSTAAIAILSACTNSAPSGTGNPGPIPPSPPSTPALEEKSNPVSVSAFSAIYPNKTELKYVFLKEDGSTIEKSMDDCSQARKVNNGKLLCVNHTNEATVYENDGTVAFELNGKTTDSKNVFLTEKHFVSLDSEKKLHIYNFETKALVTLDSIDEVLAIDSYILARHAGHLYQVKYEDPKLDKDLGDHALPRLLTDDYLVAVGKPKRGPIVLAIYQVDDLRKTHIEYNVPRNTDDIRDIQIVNGVMTFIEHHKVRSNKLHLVDLKSGRSLNHELKTGGLQIGRQLQVGTVFTASQSPMVSKNGFPVVIPNADQTSGIESVEFQLHGTSAHPVLPQTVFDEARPGVIYEYKINGSKIAFKTVGKKILIQNLDQGTETEIGTDDLELTDIELF